MTTDEKAEREELEAQLQTATEGLQRVVMRLFQDSDIHPHLVVLTLARVTGEVGAEHGWPNMSLADVVDFLIEQGESRGRS